MDGKDYIATASALQDMNPVIAKIREALQTSADDETRKSTQRLFKEEVACYGVKTAVVRKIAEKHWGEVKLLGKEKIFALCEELFRSDYVEEAFVASSWLPNMVEQLEPADLAVFKAWIEKYVNNWAKCDTFCNHTVGGLIEKHPESVTEVKSWAKSDNRWLKRAAAVSLIVPAKKGMFLREVFEISDVLLNDEDDMVQKGYGWLLKEASRKHQKEVFDYVLKNRETMPRTVLRYAIELMPKELRKEAMKRD
jgi:3-methyladenine DNA glycosylase AlkD